MDKNKVILIAAVAAVVVLVVVGVVFGLTYFN